MTADIPLLAKLAPDLVAVLALRYRILRQIQLTQPVGRRSLAASLGMTERTLRAEVEFLRDQGLLTSSPAGMSLTGEGEALVERLEEAVREWLGLTELERRLTERLSIERIVVVPGDADRSPVVKREMGKVAADWLRRHVREGDIIAVAGGTTVAAVAEMLAPASVFRSVRFVPARGGLGEQVELQANTIASRMAQKTGGQYRLLHVPDTLSEEAYQSLSAEPHIKAVLEEVRKARIVVHGIGDAFTMARRRGADMQTLERLRQAGAVAEAFGYYFDRDGRVVFTMRTLGLRIEDVARAEQVIGIAGGASKGPAIAALAQNGVPHVLITDEGAARAILEA
ncbi:MAG: sugar-binding domain-containing protein [Bacillota bacterium]